MQNPCFNYRACYSAVDNLLVVVTVIQFVGVSIPCCWGNTVVALYVVNRAKFHSETNYS